MSHVRCIQASDEVRVVCAPQRPVILGEGPVWDVRAEVLYWVDIERGELHSCNADGTQPQVIVVGERLGCIALRESQDGFIAGLEHRIGLLRLNPLSIRTQAAPKRTAPRTDATTVSAMREAASG